MSHATENTPRDRHCCAEPPFRVYCLREGGQGENRGSIEKGYGVWLWATRS